MAPRWIGRCPVCEQWNTLVEEASGPAAGRPAAGLSETRGSPPRPVAEVEADQAAGAPTGVGEFDRVLGGGLVPGSVTLIGGEPGIGKSTLVLQVAASVARQGRRCLVVSAEESAAQVRGRADRLGALVDGVWLAAETSIPAILAAVQDVDPDVLIVDSIQTVSDPDLESGAGSVAQVRGCAQRLVAEAKAGGPAIILLGHVTKEGALAGPRVLEHLVDTVLSFDGDRHHALRLLRAVKHRFGPVGELGLFEMTGAGLCGVAEPGALFLADRRVGSPGSVVFAAMEGQRPLLVEIQALVVSTSAVSPRRSATGFDSSRLAVLLAVLDRRAGLSLSGHEVFLSVAGGIRVSDPGADLAVCMALASAATNRPVDGDAVFVGEIGLGGEIRQVAHTPRRLAEAARLGFGQAVVSTELPGSHGLQVHSVSDLSGVLDGHLRQPARAPRLRLVQ